MHKNEYVVNQEQLRGVGGTANLEKLLRGNNNNGMSDIKSQNAQMIKTMEGILRILKKTTNGGHAMRTELIA